MLDLYINIKKERLKKGWNQSELAKKVGYSDKSMIAKIEAGKVDLPQTKIRAFANVFGVTESYLMGWESVSHPATAALEDIIRRNEENGGQAKLANYLRDTTMGNIVPAATSDKLHLNMISSIDIPTTSNVITDDEYNLILQYRNADEQVKDMIVQLLSYAVSKED